MVEDKGAACEAHDALLMEGYQRPNHKKAARNRPLTLFEKQFNKLMYKAKFNVKHAFCTLKRRFLMTRFRDITAPKVNGEMAFKAIGLHLLKAANSVTF